MHVKELLKGSAIRDQHRHILGGSTIASIMGIGKYSCRLREWKILRNEPYSAEFFGNSATERGRVLEPVAAQYYAEKTGRKLRKVPRKFVELSEFTTWRCLCFTTHEPGSVKECPVCHCDLPRPFFAPWSDYEIVNDARGAELGTLILSIKCPSVRVQRNMSYEGLDDAYIMQLQAELWAWNRKGGAYELFNAELWKGIEFDVDYDKAMGEAAADAILKFMVQVENGPAPEKLAATSSACAQCPFRATCQADNLLQLLAKEDGEEQTVQFKPELAPLVAAVREAKELKAEAEELEADRVEALKQAIGDLAIVETCGEDEHMRFRVYCKAQPGRESFQWAQAKKNLPKEDLAKLQRFVSISKPSRPLRLYEVPILASRG